VFDNLPAKDVWALDCALLCLALNGVAPQKPGGCNTHPMSKGPQVVWRGPYGVTKCQDPLHFIFGEKLGMACSRVEFLIF
jgi:hypothetical protein